MRWKERDKKRKRNRENETKKNKVIEYFSVFSTILKIGKEPLSQ
jgi:hypothetical protein